MGGYGSGRYSRGEGKTTIEQCVALDADRANGSLFEWPGSMLAAWRSTWSGDSFRFWAEPTDNEGRRAARLTVRKQDSDRRQEETAEMESTPTPLGGARWWWWCPGCWRRCKRLYCPPDALRFRCRLCHRLTYSSCNANHRANQFGRMIFGAGADLVERRFRADLRDDEARERRNSYRRAKRVRRKFRDRLRVAGQETGAAGKL